MKTTQNHPKTHAHQLISDKFCSLPVLHPLLGSIPSWAASPLQDKAILGCCSEQWTFIALSLSLTEPHLLSHGHSSDQFTRLFEFFIIHSFSLNWFMEGMYWINYCFSYRPGKQIIYLFNNCHNTCLPMNELIAGNGWAIFIRNRMDGGCNDMNHQKCIISGLSTDFGVGHLTTVPKTHGGGIWWPWTMRKCY